MCHSLDTIDDLSAGYWSDFPLSTHTKFFVLFGFACRSLQVLLCWVSAVCFLPLKRVRWCSDMWFINTWIWLILSRIVFKLPNLSRVVVNLAFKGSSLESREWHFWGFKGMAFMLSKISPLCLDRTPASQLHVASSSPTLWYIHTTLKTIPHLLVLLIHAWTAVFGQWWRDLRQGYSMKNSSFLVHCLKSQLCQHLRTPGSYSWAQRDQYAVWAHFLGMKSTRTCSQEAWVTLGLTTGLSIVWTMPFLQACCPTSENHYPGAHCGICHCMDDPFPMSLLSNIWKPFTQFHTSWWHELSLSSVTLLWTEAENSDFLIF